MDCLPPISDEEPEIETDFEVIAPLKPDHVLTLLYEILPDGQVYFNEAILDRIAALVGDRKIAIISTAGKPRGGKTFWLNFLLHGLRHGDAAFQDTEVIGGKEGILFKNGYSPDTKGILIWPEVFYRTDCFGEEIAVIIMDTQGTFDTETDVDQTINYSAVSLLLSSIQVINTKGNLDMLDFDSMNQFIAYSDHSGEQIGQHMFFLIRDAPKDHGLSPSFLKAIEEGSKQATRTHQLIEGVFRSFNTVESYLVPHPDPRVFDATTQIQAREIGPNFRKHLTFAANHVLNSLQPKKVQGVVMNGRTFRDYAMNVIEKMKSRSRNKVGTLFDAMKTLAFDSAKNNGRAAYKNGWTEFHQKNNFQPVPEKIYLAAEASILEQAKSAYLAVIRYGTEQTKDDHFKAFVNELVEKCEDKRVINEEKYRERKCAKAYEDSIQVYETDLQPAITQGFGQRSYVAVEKAHRQAFKKALAHFEKEIGEFFMQTAVIEARRKKLIDYIESRSTSVLRDNSIQNIEEKGRALADGAINDFRDFLMLKQAAIEKEEEIESIILEARNNLISYLLTEKTRLLQQIQKDFPQIVFEDVESYLETINDLKLDPMLKRAELDFRILTGSILKTKTLEKQIQQREEEQALKDATLRQEIGVLRAQSDALKEQSAKNLLKEAAFLTKAKQKELEAENKEKAAQAEARRTQKQIDDLREQLEKSVLDIQGHNEKEQKRREDEEVRKVMEAEEREKFKKGLEKNIEAYKARLQKELLDTRERVAERPFVVGIDLGTTYSCVGICVDGEVTIISNEFGEHTTPSEVAFIENEVLVGKPAQLQATRNSSNTIYGTKRLIGRRFNDPVIREETKHLPFTIIDVDGQARIKIEQNGEEKLYSPVEISGIILSKLKKMAESYLDRKIEKAVITVPAFFNDAQRNDTIEAAKEAGLEVLRIVNEPTAAAIAFGVNNVSEEPKTVLVYDFGGGTLDVSLIVITKGVYEVKATSGDTHLGGEDLNNKLLEHVLDDLKTKHQIELTDNKRAVMRLYMASEKAKIELSFKTKAEIHVPSLLVGFDYTLTVSRAKFEKICQSIFDRALVPVKRVIEDSKITADEIDETLMVGGSSRIPKIKKMLSELLNNKQLNTSIDPNEAVAHGAAIQAAKLSGDNNEKIRDIVFKDVTPLSLGMNIFGNIISTIIPRNSPIRTSVTKNYLTIQDDQANMRIRIYEGERKRSKDNNPLGEFSIKAPKAKRGQAKVDVTFSVNENGILEVIAEEISTGNSKTLVIEKHRMLGSAASEIENSLKDAEENRQLDDEIERAVEALKSLHDYAYDLKEANGLKFMVLDSEAKTKIQDRGSIEFKWTIDNQDEARPTYEARLAELKAFCNSFLTTSP